MPATSVKQRRAIAIAKNHPEELYKRNRSLLGMTQDQMHDYASTPEKDLPKRAKRRRKKKTLLSGKD